MLCLAGLRDGRKATGKSGSEPWAVVELSTSEWYAQVRDCPIETTSLTERIGEKISDWYPQPDPVDLSDLLERVMYDGPSFDQDTGPLPTVLTPAQTVHVAARWLERLDATQPGWVLRPGNPSRDLFPSSRLMVAPAWDDVERAVLTALATDDRDGEFTALAHAIARWSALPPSMQVAGTQQPSGSAVDDAVEWVFTPLQMSGMVAARASEEAVGTIEAAVDQLSDLVASCSHADVVGYVNGLLEAQHSLPLPASTFS